MKATLGALALFCQSVKLRRGHLRLSLSLIGLILLSSGVEAQARQPVRNDQIQATLAVSSVFLLSLFGAVVLFRFLKSSALIKKETYQAGGAVAGFVIIYSLLFGSYYKIETLKNESLMLENEGLAATIKNLQDQVHLVDLSGEVEPDKQPVKIRLVFDAIEPDSGGKFTFKVPYVVATSPTTALYAITDDTHVILDSNCPGTPCVVPESSLYLSGKDLKDLHEIKIPLRLKRR